jgi:hypothetical protein
MSLVQLRRGAPSAFLPTCRADLDARGWDGLASPMRGDVELPPAAVEPDPEVEEEVAVPK